MTTSGLPNGPHTTALCQLVVIHVPSPHALDTSANRTPHTTAHCPVGFDALTTPLLQQADKFFKTVPNHN